MEYVQKHAQDLAIALKQKIYNKSSTRGIGGISQTRITQDDIFLECEGWSPSFPTMTTKRQKAAVNFCEQVLDISFKGDIDNFNEVSEFLSEYLEQAKIIAEDAIESYYSNF